MGTQDQRPLTWVGTAPACTRLQFTEYLLTEKEIQGWGPWLRLIVFQPHGFLCWWSNLFSIRLLTLWKTQSLSKYWNIMKVWIAALTLFLRCFQKGKASMFSTVSAQAYYRSIVPSPCPSTQLTSPLCFRVESLNSSVRSKQQSQGGSAPQWRQTHWWLSPWGKLEGKDASVTMCVSGCLRLAFWHSPLHRLLRSCPTTFCSYLYKL